MRYRAVLEKTPEDPGIDDRFGTHTTRSPDQILCTNRPAALEWAKTRLKGLKKGHARVIIYLIHEELIDVVTPQEE